MTSIDEDMRGGELPTGNSTIGDDGAVGDVQYADSSEVSEVAREKKLIERFRDRTARWWSVSRVYLLIAVPAGLFFSFWIPPSQVLDESAHFFRVWQISEGHVVADVQTDPNTGAQTNSGEFDLCVRDYMKKFSDAAAAPAPFRLHDYWFETPDCSPERRATFHGEAMGSYSFWTYPGQTAGVAVGRLVGLPLPAVFFLGRVLGLSMSVLMCWYAIKIAPRAKLVLCFVALLPMSLMGASGYSPDGLVLGTSLIIIANCLRFATTEHKPKRADLIILGSALTALVLSKPPYVVLVLLFICYPIDLFGSRRRTMVRLSALAVIPLVLAAIWNRAGFPQGAVEAFRPGIDQGGQLQWIFGHPLAYANVLSDTFFYWESQEFVIKGWVGAFGMFRSGSADSPLIIPIFVLLAAAAIGFLTAAEIGQKIVHQSRGALVRSWAPMLTLILGILAIYTSAYVAWDRVGAARIYGVQGRYLIPLLPLPAVAFAIRHRRGDSAIGLRAVVLPVCILLAASYVKIAFYFY